MDAVEDTPHIKYNVFNTDMFTTDVFKADQSVLLSLQVKA